MCSLRYRCRWDLLDDSLYHGSRQKPHLETCSIPFFRAARNDAARIDICRFGNRDAKEADEREKSWKLHRIFSKLSGNENCLCEKEEKVSRYDVK